MCDRERDIHAYHDGQLSPAIKLEVQAHLAGCADCRQLLAELRGLTVMVRDLPLPELSPRAGMAAREAWRRTRDQGVRRLAEWLSMAAALLLLAMLVGSGTGKPAHPGAAVPADWELAAVTARPPVDDAAASSFALAKWFADDLTTDAGGTEQ
jgi:anti-sigma factor RsiW